MRLFDGYDLFVFSQVECKTIWICLLDSNKMRCFVKRITTRIHARKFHYCQQQKKPFKGRNPLKEATEVAKTNRRHDTWFDRVH